MKKNIFLSLVLIAFFQFSFAQVKWDLDKMHSNVQFSVEHTGISFVDGYFNEVDGEVISKTEEDFEEAEFNFTINVNSIDTRIKARNDHLLSPDFFEAEKYGTITLKNAKLYKKYDNKYYLKGDLTVKDVTKTVVFDVVKNGEIKDEDGKIHVGFTAKTKINRLDYNISYNDKLPSGIPAVGKEVKILVNVEMIQQ